MAIVSQESSQITVHEPVAVEVRNLCRSYGETQVLKDVSFQVEPGEIFVIMGPSGAGKSVLLKHIIGLERADSGEILIAGKDASSTKTHRDIRTGIVFQAGALFNSMTVYENLALYPTEHRLYDKETIRRKVMEALAIVSLEEAADKIPAELSGGMKKRVAVARALVIEPQLLLYDEPTSELDPILAATVAELIATVRKETNLTSIVVTHDTVLAKTIGNRVALLLDGRIHTIATPDELTRNDDPDIQDFLHPKIDLDNPRFRRS